MADSTLAALLAVAGIAALALGAAAYAGGMWGMGGMMGGGHGGSPMAGPAGGMMGPGMMGGHEAGESPMADGHGEAGECPCEGMMGGHEGPMAGPAGGMRGGPWEAPWSEAGLLWNGTATVVWADPAMALLGLKLPDGSEVTAKLARAYVRAGDGALVYGGWIAEAAEASGTVYVVLYGNDYRAMVAEIGLADVFYVHPMAFAAETGH